YLIREVATRNRRLVADLHALYEGRCQICLWDPRDRYGEYLCEGHHLQWISRGGADELANMALVCPNHHSAIHQCDPPLDYADLAFDCGAHRERLAANRHLGA